MDVDALTVSLTKHIGHLLRNAVDIVIGGLVLHVAHSHTAPSPVNMLFATPVHVHTTANATPAGTSGSSGGALPRFLEAPVSATPNLPFAKVSAYLPENSGGHLSAGEGSSQTAVKPHDAL